MPKSNEELCEVTGLGRIFWMETGTDLSLHLVASSFKPKWTSAMKSDGENDMLRMIKEDFPFLSYKEMIKTLSDFNIGNTDYVNDAGR